MRIVYFLAVSDSPISLGRDPWLQQLLALRIDGRPVFNPSDPEGQRVLAAYGLFADTLHASPRAAGLEYSDSLSARLGSQRIITDDNMGLEWMPMSVSPWRR